MAIDDDAEIGKRYPSDSDQGAKNIVDLVRALKEYREGISGRIEQLESSVSGIDSAIQSAVSEQVASLQQELATVDSRISAAVAAVRNQILDGVGEDFDTLMELAQAIGDNADLIGGLQDVAKSHVRYDGAQTLTDAQKTQARANIGAASDASVIHKSGDETASGAKTFSDSVTTPVAIASSYFRTPHMVGEGTLDTFYHRLDFGYAGHNQWDFYEYGGLYNFYRNTSTNGNSKVLLGSINENGWEGNVKGNVKGNADTATKATQDASGNVITDTYLTKTAAASTYLGKTAKAESAKAADSANAANAVPWSGVTGKPNTLEGYGINNAVKQFGTNAFQIFGGFSSIGNSSISVALNPAFNGEGFSVHAGLTNIELRVDGKEIPIKQNVKRYLFDGAPNTYLNIQDAWNNYDILWNSTISYVIGDYCTYNNLAYVCIQNNTNKEPNLNPEFWTRAARSSWAAGYQGYIDFYGKDVVFDIFTSKSWRYENSLAIYWRAAAQKPEYVKVEKVKSNGDTILVREDHHTAEYNNLATSYFFLGSKDTGETQEKHFRITIRVSNNQIWCAISDIAFYGLSGGIEGVLLARGGGSLVGDIYPHNSGTLSVGTNDRKWNAMYAYNFVGNLNGTASKATADANGNNIATTYAKKSDIPVPLKGDTGPQGPQGVTGPRGYTFTPSVSAAGVLSWTNNGGLDNPASVTIKGADGAAGAKGDKGDKGDTGSQGPAGPTGPRGYTFTPSVSAAGVLSWSNNGGLSNPASFDFSSIGLGDTIDLGGLS